MKTVAVVGAAGFVGSEIVRALVQDTRYAAASVVRGECLEERLADADIVVHAANPARRFRAETNPLLDFDETVEKTAQILSIAGRRRFILVSTLSCRTQLNLSYGRHRRACELLAISAKNALIVRLGPMFGGHRTQDVLHDILAGRRVYVAGETRYAYVDVAWVAREIVQWLEGPTGIREIGAHNDISLAQVAARFSSSSEFSGDDDTQRPEDYTAGPDAHEVLQFAEKEFERREQWLH